MALVLRGRAVAHIKMFELAPHLFYYTHLTDVRKATPSRMFRPFAFLALGVLVTLFMPAATAADGQLQSDEKKQEKSGRYPFPEVPDDDEEEEQQNGDKPADNGECICCENMEAVPRSDCSCVPPGILKCVATLDGFECGSQRHPSAPQWADLFMTLLGTRVALYGTSSVITLYTVGHADGVKNEDRSSGSQLLSLCSGSSLPDSLVEPDELLAAVRSCIARRMIEKIGGEELSGFGNLRWSTNRITDIDDGHESGPEYRKIEAIFEIAGACQ